jgi:GDP-4-dehydro-6-deoxy-D-mannose reductase
VNVFVTGGGGFAGRHLIRALRRRGGVRVAATLAGEVPQELRRGELADVEWLSMDLSASDSVDAVLDQVRPALVYHLAGQASVGLSLEDPILTWDVNATGTLRLMERIGQRSPGTRRVLFVSSAEVYGAVPPAEQPIPESRAVCPLTPYGSSKAAAEIVLRQAGEMRGIEVVVARSFNHIGPGQDERFVLPSVAGQLAALRRQGSGGVLRLGNLDVVRDFLDVRDVVEAYLTLMERGQAGETYNVCSGAGSTLRQVVEAMVAISGAEARIDVDSARVRAFDIPALVGDPTRVRNVGWAPGIDLERTLADLLLEREALIE